MCGCSMHKQYLLIALEQALLGRGLCAPNPSVGALAVRNDSIIAQAWHRGAGTPHAEQLLLPQFPAHTPDVTLYVTLEPCNHHGRTPPCVDAIIQHGIQRVVYAHPDPNPVVLSGNTPERLRQHGIDVLQITVPEIEQFYQSYDYWTKTGKPWVTAKIAQTFDGKIAGASQERLALSNDLCAEFTHKQRLKTDLILTTSKTVMMDNPYLNARINQDTHSKPIAILDSQLVLSHDFNVFKNAKRCHIYHDAALSHPDDTATCQYHGIKHDHHQRLDLKAVLSHLGGLGYHDVWVEAGGTLFTALHQHKLINRSYIYLVPRILGPEATPAYLSSDIFVDPQSVHWHAMGDNMIAALDW